MKKVLAHINQKKKEFAQLPLFAFLQDQSLDPRQRLAFAPCIAPFAMSFGELNRNVFRDEPTTDEIQKIINVHTYEDDHHWPWLLTDMDKLSFNPRLTFNQSLEFLWNEQTVNARAAAYYLYNATYKASPVRKFTIIEATESTGNILLANSAFPARELTQKTQYEYEYFGSGHLEVDTGHTFCSTEARQVIEAVELSEEERQSAIAAVDETFTVFTNLMNELLAFAQQAHIHPAPADNYLDYLKVTNQQNLYTDRQATPATPANEHAKPLGCYLLEANLVTHDQLEEALKEQQATDTPIGKLLAEKGWIHQHTIEYMMKNVVLPQRNQRKQASIINVG